MTTPMIDGSGSPERLFQATLEDFVQHYTGPMLHLAVTGGGVNLVRLGTILGSSRILSEVVIPYSDESQRALVESATLATPAVSEARAYQLTAALQEASFSSGELFVGVTAALTTNRYRRGENHVRWVLVYRDRAISSFDLHLPKYSETAHAFAATVPGHLQTLRTQEDLQVASAVLASLRELTPEKCEALWAS